jgi:hypothetical protein
MIRGRLRGWVVGIIISLVPVVLLAGGFQEKIQGKLKANRMSQQSNEQYYSDSDSGKGVNIQVFASEEEKFAKDEACIEVPHKPMSAPVVKESREAKKIAGETTIFAPYLVYRTDYKAEIEDDVVTVKGSVLLEVFRKGWTGIPLVNVSAGLIDAGVNRGTSFVAIQGGKYVLMIDRPGKYTLDMEFLIKAARERENGPGSFSLEVVPAPISQFEFTMPDDQAEIFVEPSLKTELRKDGKKTVAWSVIPNTTAVNVRWTKALPKETITPVALEPKVYLDTTTYAAIGEGVIRCLSTLTYSILQAEAPSFRVALPDDVTVLSVVGNELRDWKVTNDKGAQYLDVYPNFGIKGTYVLNVSFERKIAEGSGVSQIPWVRGMNVEREKGFFGIAAATSVELAVKKAEHVSHIDVKELPAQIWRNTASPILLAFKYIDHPFSIDIEVTKHEELPVLVAAIDAARYTTLQTDEGKQLTKAVYQVRNNVKQFIHLSLPPKATLWSVFVAGKPVKPAKDKSGTILVPLEKSQMSGENLAQFPVEVVYLDTVSRMSRFGSLVLRLPRTDIPVSSLHWAVYMPLEYAYISFGGDVKESRRSGFFEENMVSVASRKSVGASSRYEGYDGAQVAQQQVADVYEEMQRTQNKGVLPIKIEVPEQGQLLRFSKLLVTEKESPWVSITYYYRFPKMEGLLRFIFFILLCVGVILVLRRIKAGLKRKA